MRVPDGWKGGEGRLKCGLCVMKDVVEVRNENLKRQIEQMKNEDYKRKEVGVYEKNENVNTWATIAKRLTNEKTIEKLERVEESMMMNKNGVRKQVEESNYEARRKKRIIVFNMQEKEDKTDREQVLDMIGDMGVRVREEDVVDVVRMRKKEGVGLARPIIVEFKSEYDKWTVLRNKSDSREMNVYKKFFRAGCVERGTGEASGKSSGTESRMGVERKKCREEKLAVKVVWKNVRKICTREKQIELEEWMKKSDCDVYAINETGQNGNEYVEVGDEHKWIGTNRDWMKGKTGGVGFIIKRSLECERVICESEDVCYFKVGTQAMRYEWLLGSIYMNCEGVRGDENVVKMQRVKDVVRNAKDEGLKIMIGGDMNAHIWELDKCENNNGKLLKNMVNEMNLQIMNCV